MHEALEALFAKLGVKIYDCAEIDCGGPLDKLIASMLGQPDYSVTPHYNFAEDKIYIPADHRDYDQVAAHELIHLTGHDSRSGRRSQCQRDLCCFHHAFCLEEMVADFGALLLLDKLGLAPSANRRRAIAQYRYTFRGSNSNLTKREAHAKALADAQKAVAYLLTDAQQVQKAA